jgi:hypothetical protein
MAAKNAGHKLLGVWKAKYREAHGTDYIGSKYRDAGMLKGIADDIGEAAVLEAMDFYFGHKAIHDFSYFAFNYDALLREKSHYERDKQRVELVRQRTRERMKELEDELRSTTD